MLLEMQIPPEVLTIRIMQYFTKMGIPTYLKGYRYLLYAVRASFYHPLAMRSMNEGLFCRIAEEYGTTPSGVERAGRTAVKRIKAHMLARCHYDEETISVKRFIKLAVEILSNERIAVLIPSNEEK